jgi:crotonobetainyl-CoA:carnitine CoA-transferase CaiB-like acyl-CoA transferase
VTLPLAGLQVLDLSRLLPGGYCTLVLADLGADVLKIEEPGKGDYIRWLTPMTSSGESGPHLALNRGKRSMTLNLKTDEGRALLRDLARTADVLVESFRPRVMDRLGVGYEALREVNAGLVYAAISGYGATGPYVDRAGHDIDYLAYAGALSFSGHASTGPWPPGLQIGDLGGGGLLALVAILTALRVRDATGEGQFCDISMTDGVFSWLSIHAGAYAATGRPPQPGREHLNGGFAWYAVYECADGRHVAVGALEPQFFAVLAKVLDCTDLLEAQLDPLRQDEVRERMAAAFATRSRAEWLAELEPLDSCVAPVNDLDEAFADPQLQARGMVAEHVLPDGTRFRQVGVVPRLSATPGRVGTPASPLGADTDDVLAALGRSADDIATLRAAGVV